MPWWPSSVTRWWPFRPTCRTTGHRAIGVGGGRSPREPDIVFANAGIAGATARGQSTSHAGLRERHQDHATGVFLTIQAIGPHSKDGASIILTGSVHAVMGWPGHRLTPPPGGGAVHDPRAGLGIGTARHPDPIR